MKKIVSLIIAVLLCMATLVGCTPKDNSGLSDFKNRPNKVVVTYSSNAYGKAWLTEIAKEYMTSHNLDTYVELKQTVVPTEEKSKISSGTASSDLYFMDVHFEDLGKGSLENLADVYQMNAYGESTKIIDKVNPSMYNHHENSGMKDYIMHYQNAGMGYGLVYNKGVLAKAYPNGYTLPRTTDELLAMGEVVKGSGDYLLTCSFEDNTDWMGYAQHLWFAQRCGLESYKNFMNGKYLEGSEWIFNETEPVIYDKYEDQIKDWWQVYNDLFQPANGYIHKDSNSIDFMEAEAVMAGYGFGQNDKDTAFLVHAVFIESEMDWMLADQEAAGNKQELGMAKLPVISSIIERTPSITTDAKLAEVVSYVDGEVATKPEGVTDADIAIVKEAREMLTSYMGGGVVMPKGARNKEGAKEFLTYIASDEAAIIAAKNTYGIPMLPYGKIPTEEEMGITRTDFMKDCIKHISTSNAIISSDLQEFAFSYHTPHRFYKQGSASIKALFTGNGQTPVQLFNELKNYFADTSAGESRWVTSVRDYKIAMGLN